MKNIFLLFLLFTFTFCNAQSKDEKAIRLLMDRQQNAWNQGNIEEFMEGYWNSDSLMFIGKNGVTYGWMSTLNNYKKGYPDTAAMGKLTFTLIKMKRLSKEFFFVVGKWFLKRSIGDIGGHFNLLFQKMNGRWYIIADHSS
jgi:hypothetical protein